MKQKRFSLTLSVEAYDWLKTKAESNYRSLSKQTNMMLEEIRKKEIECIEQEVKRAA